MATFPLIAAIGQAIVKLLLALMAIFLILLVLVQRGRGGGLAGALGGMGGSSAFGAKAGDVFTRVTIVAAAIWILLCIVAANFGPSNESRIDIGTSSPPPAADLGAGPAMTGPATEEDQAAEADVATEKADAEPASSGEAASEAAESDEKSEQ